MINSANSLFLVFKNLSNATSAKSELLKINGEYFLKSRFWFFECVINLVAKNCLSFLFFENSNNLSKLRWTLDTESDYIFLKEIIESFENNTYNMYDILEKLKSKEK